ncbi:MAG: DoxX family membrane protein [Nitriliruptorales bacterium]|nr:DoxX family membrane protein [Nitriliruptorales bacterium]
MKIARREGITDDFHYIPEPKAARWLFGSRQAAWLWLFPRLWLGFYWTKFGWEKVFGAESDWMTTGETLQTYLNFQIDPEAPAVYFGWYGDFVGFLADNAGFYAKAIAVGELLIGLGLLVGLFTGIAAFFGIVLNAGMVFAAFGGPAPLFLLLEVGLLLAWRNAGYVGLDRWALPMLGTPTEPGWLFVSEEETGSRGRTKTAV